MVMMDCDPLPAPRPQVTKRGTFYPRAYTEHAELLGWRMRKAFGRRDAETGALGMIAYFVVSKRHRRDRDNFLKTVQDAGNGILWADDHQIVEGFERVFWDPKRPRTELLVYRTWA
jgi:Holliday junction resolvase RusA-like endonuclease